MKLFFDNLLNNIVKHPGFHFCNSQNKYSLGTFPRLNTENGILTDIFWSIKLPKSIAITLEIEQSLSNLVVLLRATFKTI